MRPASIQAGFTLLELLVVLVIMGLLFIALPQLAPAARESAQLKESAGQIAAALRTAQGTAIARNRVTRFVFDPQNASYRVEPQGPQASLRPHFSLTVEDANPAIAFFPDGSSKGGRLSLSSPSGKTKHITIQALSGRIRIDD